MQILTGKHAGHTATLHQFANDWMTVDITDGDRNVIVKPTQVRLDEHEHAAMQERYLAHRDLGDQSAGRFWAEWQLNDDGTFTRQPRTTTNA